jgi:hypothetical protein
MTQEPRKGSKASMTLRLNLEDIEWLRTITREHELKSPAEGLSYLRKTHTDALPKRIITNFGPLIREFKIGCAMASILNTMRLITLEAIPMGEANQSVIDDKLKALLKDMIDSKKGV